MTDYTPAEWAEHIAESVKEIREKLASGELPRVGSVMCSATTIQINVDAKNDTS